MLELEQTVRLTSQAIQFNWFVRLVHVGILAEQPSKLLENSFQKIKIMTFLQIPNEHLSKFLFSSLENE